MGPSLLRCVVGPRRGSPLHGKEFNFTFTCRLSQANLKSAYRSSHIDNPSPNTERPSPATITPIAISPWPGYNTIDVQICNLMNIGHLIKLNSFNSFSLFLCIKLNPIHILHFTMVISPQPIIKKHSNIV